MKISLRYGRGELPVELPDDEHVDVLHMHPVAPVENAPAAVTVALREPISAPSLRELARGKHTACIVICDVTRPVPNAVLLPPILDELALGGIPRDAVTILVATGLHRPNEGDELREMVGDEIYRSCRIENHAARDEASHEQVYGDFEYAAIDRRYLAADLKILTGLVEPHLMAGYSGGRKVVCPGLASEATIRRFHCPAMMEPATNRAGNLDGNSVHTMSRAVAGAAGVDFIVNVTLDEPRRITGVFAGDLDAAHAAAIANADRMVRVGMDAPADIVVTSCAGHPLDATFYQSVKGLAGAMPAVKPGGTIIMAAAITEGIGGPEFKALLRSVPNLEGFRSRLWSDGFYCTDQWQLQWMLKVLDHAEVMLVTDGLNSDAVRACFLEPAVSVEEGVQRALRKHGPGSRIVAIPEGPYVLPCPN